MPRARRASVRPSWRAARRSAPSRRCRSELSSTPEAKAVLMATGPVSPRALPPARSKIQARPLNVTSDPARAACPGSRARNGSPRNAPARGTPRPSASGSRRRRGRARCPSSLRAPASAAWTASSSGRACGAARTERRSPSPLRTGSYPPPDPEHENPRAAQVICKRCRKLGPMVSRETTSFLQPDGRSGLGARAGRWAKDFRAPTPR